MKEKRTKTQPQQQQRVELYRLPTSWKWVTVADVGANQKHAIVDGPFGSNLKLTDYVEGGPVPVLTTKNLEGNYDNVRYISQAKFEELKRSAVYPGDLLVAKIGSCGKTGIYPQGKPPAMIPANLLKVTLNSDYDLKYVYYYFNSPFFQNALKTIVKATAQPAFGVTNFRTLPLPYAPPEQQKRIVAEIEKQFSRLDEAVANLKRVKANLKRYKAAVLKAAVEGKLTEEWRKAHPDVEPASELLKRILAERREKWKEQTSSRYKNKYVEPQPPDTVKLPRLPDGWTWASCEQICDFITKGTTPTSSKLREGKGEIRFLKVYNLTFTGLLDYNHKPAFVDRVVHEGELARSKVQAGDVLINIVGPPLGQVSLVPSEITEANINQAIARFRPIPGILGKFLALVLMTESIMSWAISRAKTTAGQANLTLELCRELPIPIVPIAEQHRIVAELERCLSITAEAEIQIDDNLKRGEHLRQSILQRAFEGNLLREKWKTRPHLTKEFPMAAEPPST